VPPKELERATQGIGTCHSGKGTCQPEVAGFLVFVSRGFAPAPGSATRARIANMNFPTPFAEPQGRATQGIGTCHSRDWNVPLGESDVPTGGCWVLGLRQPGLRANPPGSATQACVANVNFPTPFAKPQGRATLVKGAPGSVAKFSVAYLSRRRPASGPWQLKTFPPRKAFFPFPLTFPLRHSPPRNACEIAQLFFRG
jgi:hypothetical protein